MRLSFNSKSNADGSGKRTRIPPRPHQYLFHERAGCSRMDEALLSVSRSRLRSRTDVVY